jgi:hypothetical protein
MSDLPSGGESSTATERGTGTGKAGGGVGAGAMLCYCNLDTTLLQAVRVRVDWLKNVLSLRSEMVESVYPPLDLEGTQTREEILRLIESWDQKEGSEKIETVRW